MRLAPLLAVAAAGATPWSAPAVLSACAAAPGPRVVFPSDSPSQATGAGAIVWSASASCPGGEGARVAAIGAGDLPGASSIPRSAAGQPLAPRGALLASGAPHGQIVIAGSSPQAPSDGLLIQGAAGGPFAALQPSEGSAAPMALATGYLGDVALVSPPAANGAGDPGGATGHPDSPAGPHTDALNVHVERFFAHDFVRNLTADTAGTGPLEALTLAMDYRSEVLAVWAQEDALYARVVPNRGDPRPLQRLASVGLHPEITAVISDDERAIVAWSEQLGSETAVYIDRSAAGVHFGAPELLERFRNPDGLPSPAASPRLVRLSSESVMLAWAGSTQGRWVVRTAPVTLRGVGSVATIAAPGTDALLAGLAAGPDADALVLWTEPLPTAAGPPDMERQALFAARGFDGYHEHAIFGEPELLSPPAPVSDATVALDPASDRAVAVWQGEASTIDYSIRTGGAGP
ncbi:MAG: hypothetical protein ACLP8S_10890 [Solirubrobacteraceae bacterium]